jgi:alpha-glucosidase
MLLTLRGTPTIYQGKEIGMTDVVIPNEPGRDPWKKNVPGLGLGRDPERTPMERDGGVRMRRGLAPSSRACLSPTIAAP